MRRWSRPKFPRVVAAATPRLVSTEYPRRRRGVGPRLWEIRAANVLGRGPPGLVRSERHDAGRRRQRLCREVSGPRRARDGEAAQRASVLQAQVQHIALGCRPFQVLRRFRGEELQERVHLSLNLKDRSRRRHDVDGSWVETFATRPADDPRRAPQTIRVVAAATTRPSPQRDRGGGISLARATYGD